MRLCLYAVSSIWKRDMLRLRRQKSRLLGSLFAPFFLLAFLGLGFRRAGLPGMDTDYLSFLTPGMMAMTLLSASNSTSFLMLWDREKGFLKEIMVTPISRLSIILGRASVGITNAIDTEHDNPSRWPGHGHEALRRGRISALLCLHHSNRFNLHRSGIDLGIISKRHF